MEVQLKRSDLVGKKIVAISNTQAGLNVSVIAEYCSRHRSAWTRQLGAVVRNKKIPYWPSAIDIPLIVLGAIEENAPMKWGDGSLAIAVPDVMIPGEYYESRRAASSLNPTKRLMLAVLLDGIRSFQTAAEGVRKSAQRRFEDAETWLFDENGDGPFSFESICEELRIEPQYLRSGLKRWRTLHLAGKSTQRLGRNAPVVRSGQIIISHSRTRRSRMPHV